MTGDELLPSPIFLMIPCELIVYFAEFIYRVIFVHKNRKRAEK